MHELSIASGLVEKLLDFSEKNPDKKIVEVRLAVGELSHIEGNSCGSATGNLRDRPGGQAGN
jgi:Zn finger protein HypA/HybF involved in hydrogenase expression